MPVERVTSGSAEETFELGQRLGRQLTSGDVVLLFGGLGAGKTLLTKGILHALEYDVDEVTSPSFTLVNLYNVKHLEVYHIDLWRLDNAPNTAEAVGLHEIVENENAITIIEWADRLGEFELPNNTIDIRIDGDGDEPRTIDINHRHDPQRI